jgi:uncharacterized membrane protein YuzA (DUF378 family)
MNKLNGTEWLALILVVVGGLNWGLVGLLNFDLVGTIFGNMSILSRIIYTLVGVSSVYILAIASKLSKK